MANAPCLVSLANARKCARKDLTFHKKSLTALYKKMCAVHYLNIIHLGFIGKFCSIFLIHCNLPHPQDAPFTPNPTDCPWVSEDEFTCNKGCFQQLSYSITLWNTPNQSLQSHLKGWQRSQQVLTACSFHFTLLTFQSVNKISKEIDW